MTVANRFELLLVDDDSDTDDVKVKKESVMPVPTSSAKPAIPSTLGKAESKPANGKKDASKPQQRVSKVRRERQPTASSQEGDALSANVKESRGIRPKNGDNRREEQGDATHHGSRTGRNSQHDRHSTRNSTHRRRVDGEKNQTVGRGNWGKPTDVAPTADRAEATEESSPTETEKVEEPAAVQEEKPAAVQEEKPAAAQEKPAATEPEPPKIAYKTVKEYLAEIDSHRTRVNSIESAMKLRRANEGAEADAGEVVNKKASGEPVYFGKVARTATKKASPQAPKQHSSTSTKMTIQELAKIPSAAPAREARTESQQSRRRDDSAASSRPQPQRRRFDSSDNSSVRSRRFDGGSERRAGEDVNRHQAPIRMTVIDMDDRESFPSLAA